MRQGTRSFGRPLQVVRSQCALQGISDGHALSHPECPQARVIQHEYDHLEGVLWIEKANIKDTQKLLPELVKIKNREVKPQYPFT